MADKGQNKTFVDYYARRVFTKYKMSLDGWAFDLQKLTHLVSSAVVPPIGTIAGTSVLLENGSATRNSEDLSVRDRLFPPDPTDLVEVSVNAQAKSATAYAFVTDGSKTLSCASDQLIMSPNGGPVSASQLVTGNEVMTIDGNETVVSRSELGSVACWSAPVNRRPMWYLANGIWLWEASAVSLTSFEFHDYFDRSPGSLGSPWSYTSKGTGNAAAVVSGAGDGYAGDDGKYGASARHTSIVSTAPSGYKSGFSEMTWVKWPATLVFGGPCVLFSSNAGSDFRYVLQLAIVDTDQFYLEARIIRTSDHTNGSSGTDVLLAIDTLRPLGTDLSAIILAFFTQPIQLRTRLSFDVQPTKTVLTALYHDFGATEHVFSVDDASGSRYTTGKPGFEIHASDGSATSSHWDNYYCETYP